MRALYEFHQGNEASILSLLGYCKLAVHFSALQEHGLVLGPASVYGKGNSGKSQAAKHVMMTFPRTGSSHLSFSTILTCSIAELRKLLSSSAHPIIQDHPPIDMSGLNALIDNYFENGLKRTRTSHNDNHPITGLILIWSHEQANLGRLEESSLSKGVFFLHTRSNDDSFDFLAAKDKILEYAETSSAFFRFYLKEPNWNEVKSLQREKIVLYNEVLSKKINTEDVSKASRILENCALVHASTMVLLKENDFHLGVGIEELDEQITRSYLEEYIPAIVKIKAKKGHYSKEEEPSADDGMSLEDMEAHLVQVIDDLSLKDTVFTV